MPRIEMYTVVANAFEYCTYRRQLMSSVYDPSAQYAVDISQQRQVHGRDLLVWISQDSGKRKSGSLLTTRVPITRGYLVNIITTIIPNSDDISIRSSHLFMIQHPSPHSKVDVFAQRKSV